MSGGMPAGPASVLCLQSAKALVHACFFAVLFSLGKVAYFQPDWPWVCPPGWLDLLNRFAKVEPGHESLGRLFLLTLCAAFHVAMGNVVPNTRIRRSIWCGLVVWVSLNSAAPFWRPFVGGLEGPPVVMRSRQLVNIMPWIRFLVALLIWPSVQRCLDTALGVDFAVALIRQARSRLSPLLVPVIGLTSGCIVAGERAGQMQLTGDCW